MVDESSLASTRQMREFLSRISPAGQGPTGRRRSAAPGRRSPASGSRNCRSPTCAQPSSIRSCTRRTRELLGSGRTLAQKNETARGRSVAPATRPGYGDRRPAAADRSHREAVRREPRQLWSCHRTTRRRVADQPGCATRAAGGLGTVGSAGQTLRIPGPAVRNSPSTNAAGPASYQPSGDVLHYHRGSKEFGSTGTAMPR